jgi:hypothetical protein
MVPELGVGRRDTPTARESKRESERESERERKRERES